MTFLQLLRRCLAAASSCLLPAQLAAPFLAHCKSALLPPPLLSHSALSPQRRCIQQQGAQNQVARALQLLPLQRWLILQGRWRRGNCAIRSRLLRSACAAHLSLSAMALNGAIACLSARFARGAAPIASPGPESSPSSRSGHRNDGAFAPMRLHEARILCAGGKPA